MRQERIIQASLFDIFAPHEIGRVEADLAVARSASSIDTPGQQRFAPRRGAQDRPTWPAGGSHAALRAAEAIPPAAAL
jgi:hypothetical protein